MTEDVTFDLNVTQTHIQGVYLIRVTDGSGLELLRQNVCVCGKVSDKACNVKKPYQTVGFGRRGRRCSSDGTKRRPHRAMTLRLCMGPLIKTGASSVLAPHKSCLLNGPHQGAVAAARSPSLPHSRAFLSFLFPPGFVFSFLRPSGGELCICTFLKDLLKKGF